MSHRRALTNTIHARVAFSYNARAFASIIYLLLYAQYRLLLCVYIYIYTVRSFGQALFFQSILSEDFNSLSLSLT